MEVRNYLAVRQMSFPKFFEKLNEKDVRRFVGATIFNRGLGYHLTGRVRAAYVTDSTIRAEVVGRELYDVEITIPRGSKKLDEVEFDCTCPYGAICKHCVAVLLSWVKNKNAFSFTDSLNFDNMEKQELVKIIKCLVKENPSLISRIRFHSGQISIDEITKGLRDAFDQSDYFVSTKLIKELNNYGRILGELINAGKANEARALLLTILDIIEEKGESLDDSNGRLQDFLAGVLDLSKKCFNSVKEKAIFLERVMRYCENDDTGYGDCIRDTIIELFETEPSFLEEYLQKRINATKVGLPGEKEKASELAGMLLDLYDSTGQDEKYLALCRRGDYEYSDMAMIDKLIQLKRFNEGLRFCKELIERNAASPYIYEKHKELCGRVQKKSISTGMEEG